jgi:hypothetical protein
LILQNIHRYFLYFAFVVLAFLWIDVFHAFNFHGKFGIGLGTIVLLAGTTLLSCYTFSCHSLRHILGGKRDCFGNPSTGVGITHKVWRFISKMNEHHMLWAWLSLFAVQLSDLYVWMVASGRIADLRLL